MFIFDVVKQAEYRALDNSWASALRSCQQVADAIMSKVRLIVLVF